MNGLCYYGAIQGGKKETLFDIQEPECPLGERERECVYVRNTPPDFHEQQ